jgi:hypothetical protein
MASGGGDWKQYKAVKVDIHQTMVQADHAPELGAPTPGVVGFLHHVQDRGYRIVLSCGGFRGGAAEDASFKQKVTAWLKKNRIDTDRVDFSPDERYIIDISDRAVTYRGDWGAMWAETKSRMDHLEKTKSPDGQKPKPVTRAGDGEGPGAPPPLKGA